MQWYDILDDNPVSSWVKEGEGAHVIDMDPFDTLQAIDEAYP